MPHMGASSPEPLVEGLAEGVAQLEAPVAVDFRGSHEPAGLAVRGGLRRGAHRDALLQTQARPAGVVAHDGRAGHARARAEKREHRGSRLPPRCSSCVACTPRSVPGPHPGGSPARVLHRGTRRTRWRSATWGSPPRWRGTAPWSSSRRVYRSPPPRAPEASGCAHPPKRRSPSRRTRRIEPRARDRSESLDKSSVNRPTRDALCVYPRAHHVPRALRCRNDAT